MYIEGSSKEQIAKKFDLPVRSVTSLLTNVSKEYKNEIEKTFYSVTKARENRKIAEVKDKMIKLVEEAIDEGLESDGGKMAAVKILESIYTSVDRIERLNNEKATDIIETKNTVIDVAAIVKDLKTTEDKKAYLLKQIEKK